MKKLLLLLLIAAAGYGLHGAYKRRLPSQVTGSALSADSVRHLEEVQRHLRSLAKPNK